MTTNLEDFCIDRLLLLVEKSDHLNSQVGREAAEFGLEGSEDGFRREIFKLKVSNRATDKNTLNHQEGKTY